MMRLAVMILLASLASPALGQNFSCRIGTNPACLSYGDTICSPSGMCVDKDAACFDKYQCDYEGFTCKSNVTECVTAHNKLLGDYNALVKKHNELSDAARVLNSALSDARNCLSLASTVEDARLCAP